jgi:hypothetical protein
MQSPDQKNSDIERLSREVADLRAVARRQRRAMIVLLLAVGVFVSTGAAFYSGAFDLVRARRVEVVDEKGDMRVLIASDKDGGFVAIHDASGTETSRHTAKGHDEKPVPTTHNGKSILEIRNQLLRQTPEWRAKDPMKPKQDEVRALLGEPDSVSSQNNTGTMWVYRNYFGNQLIVTFDEKEMRMTSAIGL